MRRASTIAGSRGSIGRGCMRRGFGQLSSGGAEGAHGSCASSRRRRGFTGSRSRISSKSSR
ncbi:Hypothetical protein A7982_11738 [Minicystis rosea]|nr:Hypothetical protein A7982_11738 [Minicystis rosea]